MFARGKFLLPIKKSFNHPGNENSNDLITDQENSEILFHLTTLSIFLLRIIYAINVIDICIIKNFFTFSDLHTISLGKLSETQ